MTATLAAFGALSAALPDPGEPDIIALGGTLGGFFGGIYGLLGATPTQANLYRFAFLGGMIGTGFGLALYLIGLVTGIY